MVKQNLPEMFEGMVSEIVDAEGVYPMPFVIVDNSEKVHMGMCASDAPAMVTFMETECRKLGATEFVFGLDTYCKEMQGTTLDSCVIIFHAKNGLARVGVWEYSTTGLDVETKPTNWGNEFWNGQYTQLCQNVAKWLFDGGEHVHQKGH